MNPVQVLNREFSYNDSGNLIIQNNRNVKVKTELSGSFFNINVGNLFPSENGLEIVGKKSGRRSTVTKENLNKLIAFVDDKNQNETKFDQDGYTIKVKKISTMSENKKIIKLNESDITEIIKKVLSEQENERYMFFSNLQQIRRQCGLLLSMDENMIEEILSNGHDWAQDHIAEAKNNMDQVFDFLMNESKKEGMELSMDIEDGDMVSEGKKKAGTKLCARGKAAAKAKFKVYPSAYANGYAVQVCKGKMPGTDGKKRCSPPYC